ncbi:MAG TPA: hypothetical protein VMT28_17925 [Terriglobales bacterium]|jgi:hypothetical protein|nr:hypothetical protein [Terriglobales bacterium]
MKKCSLLLAGVALFAPLAGRAQTVDEIVAKSLAARGGVARIKAVQTQLLMGHIALGPDTEGMLQVEMKRPGKIREEVTLNGVTRIRTSDGSTGWLVVGTGEPRPLSADELKSLADSADIDGPLLDYKAKGNRIELLGKEQVEGKDTYKLLVTESNGSVRYDYIDCVSYLGVKWEGKIQANSQELEAESFFHDYRPVDGLMYAFAIDSDTLGTQRKQKLVFDKIEVNPVLDDARFGKPSAQPAAAKPAQ